jgi:hypothetical protein
MLRVSCVWLQRPSTMCCCCSDKPIRCPAQPPAVAQQHHLFAAHTEPLQHTTHAHPQESATGQRSASGKHICALASAFGACSGRAGARGWLLLRAVRVLTWRVGICVHGQGRARRLHQFSRVGVQCCVCWTAVGCCLLWRRSQIPTGDGRNRRGAHDGLSESRTRLVSQQPCSGVAAIGVAAAAAPCPLCCLSVVERKGTDADWQEAVQTEFGSNECTQRRQQRERGGECACLSAASFLPRLSACLVGGILLCVVPSGCLSPPAPPLERRQPAAS